MGPGCRSKERGVTHARGERSVSILVTCYNKAFYLEQCLNSVLLQTYKNWELIFWDDNSTDNSFKVFNKWFQKNKSKIAPSRFQFHTSSGLWKEPMFVKPPLGVIRWIAAEFATGDYVALLDADDFWSPFKLEKQMKLFNDEEVKLVYSDCCYVSRAGVNDRTFHDNYPPITSDPWLGLLTRYNFMPCCSLVFEKEALFDAVGSPSHYTGNEDYDWLLKVTAKYKSTYVPEPLAYYRTSSSGLCGTARNTAGEIDCIKRNMNNRKLTQQERRKARNHLIWTYCKLIYKEIGEWKKNYTVRVSHETRK